LLQKNYNPNTKNTIEIHVLVKKKVEQSIKIIKKMRGGQ